MNKDYEETELISTTANYRAVGPTAEAYVGSAGAWAGQADPGGWPSPGSVLVAQG